MRDLHKRFASTLTYAMAVKVELVLGKDNRIYYQEKYGASLREVKLWGLEKPFSIHCLYHNKSIIRLIIFIHHPEWIYHVWKSEQTSIMDTGSNIAAQLAGIYKDMNKNYFESWTRYHKEPKAFTEEEKAKNAAAKGASKATAKVSAEKKTPAPKIQQTSAADEEKRVTDKAQIQAEKQREKRAIEYDKQHQLKLAQRDPRETVAGKVEAGKLALEAAKKREREEGVLDRINERDENDDIPSRCRGVMSELVMLEEGGSDFLWEEVPLYIRRWIQSHFPDVSSEITLIAVAQTEFNRPKLLKKKRKMLLPSTTWTCIDYLMFCVRVKKSVTKQWGENAYNNMADYNEDAQRKDLLVKAEKGFKLLVKCSGCGNGQHDDTNVRWCACSTLMFPAGIEESSQTWQQLHLGGHPTLCQTMDEVTFFRYQFGDYSVCNRASKSTIDYTYWRPQAPEGRLHYRPPLGLAPNI